MFGDLFAYSLRRRHDQHYILPQCVGGKIWQNSLGFIDLHITQRQARASATCYEKKPTQYLAFLPKCRLGFELVDKPEEIARKVPKIRSLKEGGMSPEIQQELEALRGVGRGTGILQSVEFQRQYSLPIQNH